MAILWEARRNDRCAVCGTELDYHARPKSTFCSPRCSWRFRDRRRYAENPEAMRAKSRRYYEANREKVLEKAAAKRGRPRAALTECSECGGPLEGRRRVVCSERCRELRFKRLHPESYAQRERAKVERRRERRRASAQGGEEA